MDTPLRAHALKLGVHQTGATTLHVSEIEYFVEYDPVDVGPEAVEHVLAKMDPAFRDEMRDLIAKTSLETRRLVWSFLGHLAPSSMYKLLGLEDPRRVQEDCLLSCRNRRGW